MNQPLPPHATARRRLPPLSPMAQRIVEQVTREDADLGALTRLIELDPGLTVAVLKLVNSPFYGLQRQVGTVNEAIMVLGMATVRRVAIASAIAGPLQGLGLKRELLAGMWRHAISGAVLASRLLDGHAASQIAFTAGVLQDLGRLALHLDAPAAYAPLEPLGGADLCAGELAACGQTHAAVGATLAESWALPTPIVEAIALHHRAADQPGAGAAAQAVWLASRIVDGEPAGAEMPSLRHVQVDPVSALAASRCETDALCALVGA